MGSNKLDELAVTCPTEKIIVRRIPPELPEKEFKELFTPCVEGEWNGYYRYVPGHVAEDMYDETTFARAYIHFDRVEQSEKFMQTFREKVNHDPEHFRVERAIYLHIGPFEEEPVKEETKPLESDEYFQRYSEWYNNGCEGEPPHLLVPTTSDKKTGNGKKSKKKDKAKSKTKVVKAKAQEQQEVDKPEMKGKDQEKDKAKSKAKKEKKKKKQAVNQDKSPEDAKTTSAATSEDTPDKPKPKKRTKKSKAKSKDPESSSEPNDNSNETSKSNDLENPSSASAKSKSKSKITIKQRPSPKPEPESNPPQDNPAKNSSTVSIEA
ncbi:BA75_01310T0 [Komagataella pastoris]|uniref:BA75_01310T0 n=1 Tax=Komagataella pastoris TaxID=4922 RepID=A0A1B2J8Q9_PICPA|nr:BA75_01310T0 [Komagataella pastoris]